MRQPDHERDPEGVSGTALAPDLRARFEQLERVLGGLEAPSGETLDPGEDAVPGSLAVVAYPLVPGGDQSDVTVAYRPHERFPSASTIKVYVLQALLEKVAAGDADLDDELPVAAEDMVSGSGVLKTLMPNRYRLRDLATLMIVVSDNTATNVLMEFLGVDVINASVLAHGWTGTHSAGKLQVAQTVGEGKRVASSTTAADLADYFARLWRGELLPPLLTEEARAIYRKQQYGELGRSIAYDSYLASIGEAPWRIASKSGSITGVRNDAGVFEPLATARAGAAPFVVSIMTKGCVDGRFHSENLGAKVVGWAAAAVFERLS
ncbi:MAG: serine hydrolase [Truepera sp.]|mgnify:CR=1 FL=1|jgi:beta-lactamase class A|nr:serine hydrolase [Truepera sp.]HRN17889.1 class A beta-lactamase-related serine hydrolase [Trueperaceae bacterium]HRQ09411.1 class A beta-lactamase-related serine hydrolase [Trueperaceae bacterium]